MKAIVRAIGRYFDDSQGFTLLEILLAIVLLSIVGAVITGAFVQSAMIQSMTGRAEVATDLAASRIEEYRAAVNRGDYAYLVSRTTEEEQPALNAAGRNGYSREVLVTQSGEINRSWTIVVNVSYLEGGQTRSASVQTVLAER